MFKFEMRKQHGVMRCEVDEWPDEYTFKKGYFKGYCWDVIKMQEGNYLINLL